MNKQDKKHNPSASRRRAEPNRQAMVDAIEAFLSSAGLEVSGELARTPQKAAEAWADSFLDGYAIDPATLFAERYEATSTGASTEAVTVRNINFHGLCPHHLLPFRGTAIVSYVPDKNLASLSSLVRLVDCFAHRLEIQETVTRQVAEALYEHLPAKGVAVALSADQACMTMRGVTRVGANTLTEYYIGSFHEEAALRAQFQRRLEP